MNLDGICLNKNMSFLGMFGIPDLGFLPEKFCICKMNKLK